MKYRVTMGILCIAVIVALMYLLPEQTSAPQRPAPVVNDDDKGFKIN